MKKRLLMLLAIALTGCSTDNAKSLSRDYRNLHNEALDAVMMITSESRAKFAKEKVFKPFQSRMEVIDKRMATWLQNTEDKEIIQDTLRSDSAPLLLAECKINQRRLEAERKRLQKLVEAKAQDASIAIEDAGKNWPTLVEFAKGSPLASLKSSLEKGTKFGDIVGAFEGPQWKKAHPPDFKELMDVFKARLGNLEK